MKPQALYPDNNSTNSTGRQRLPTATAIGVDEL